MTCFLDRGIQIWYFNSRTHSCLFVHLLVCFLLRVNANIFGFYSNSIPWQFRASFIQCCFEYNTTPPRTAQLMQLPHELSTVLCYRHIKQVQARTFTYSLEMLSHSKCFLCNANYVRDMINYFQRNAFLRLFHVSQNNEMWNPRNATLERITETHVHEKWFTLILHVEIRTHALQSLSTTATKCVFVHENEGFSPRMLSVKLLHINKHRDCIHTNCHQRIKESKRMLGIVDNISKMATSTTAEQRR